MYVHNCSTILSMSKSRFQKIQNNFILTVCRTGLKKLYNTGVIATLLEMLIKK